MWSSLQEFKHLFERLLAHNRSVSMLTLILLIVAIAGLLAVIMRREAGALPALAVLAVTRPVEPGASPP
jgi:uncharacterized membrane protein